MEGPWLEGLLGKYVQLRDDAPLAEVFKTNPGSASGSGEGSSAVSPPTALALDPAALDSTLQDFAALWQ
eukprot:11223308-Lingulodinium_polyedra.AAC.1